MKIVEVNPLTQWLVYGSGALAGFILKWGIQKGHFPLYLDYIHLLPIVVTITGLTYCVIMKRAGKATVSLWVWLPTFGGVGWFFGTWVASRFG